LVAGLTTEDLHLYHESMINSKVMKFNTQDRIVLDEMVDTFTTEMIKQQHEYDLDGKRPIITKEYWFQMIKQVQE
jgi:hypothetical protein